VVSHRAICTPISQYNAFLETFWTMATDTWQPDFIVGIDFGMTCSGE
jgi:hypothetical protein